MTLSLEELISTAQPRTFEVRVCARGDLVDRHAALVAQLDEASQDPQSIGGIAPELRRIAQEILDVEAEQEEHTLVFVLQSVSRRVWSDLITSNPPREIDKGMDHNPVTFPVAAVAACSKSPKVSHADAERLAEVLPAGEWKKLWDAVLILNRLETPHPKLPSALSIARESADS